MEPLIGLFIKPFVNRTLMWVLKNMPMEAQRIDSSVLLNASYSPEFSLALKDPDRLMKPFIDKVTRGWKPTSVRVNNQPEYWSYVVPTVINTYAELFNIEPSEIEFELADPLSCAKLIESIEFLEIHDNCAFKTISQYVREVVPFTSNKASSFSGPEFLATIFINVVMTARGTKQTCIDLVDSLVHESAHVMLQLYLDTGHPLVETTEHLYTSPWRPDPRPSKGILHGTFAFWNVCRVLHRLGNDILPLRDQILEGCNTLLSTNELTDEGTQIIKNIRNDITGDFYTWTSDLPYM